MALVFHNTLTRQKEEFRPLRAPHVSFYTCGPTVYAEPHIGNLRTFVTSDLVRRVLERRGYEVRQVVNITDVDDKTIAGARKNNLPLTDFTRGYEKKFLDALAILNILPPAALPRATEFIGPMIVLIEKLLERGLAYRAADGIYFRIAAFPAYGRLAQAPTDPTGEQGSAEADFALWKFWKPEDGKASWDAPRLGGRGRPGWHIECSAMIAATLDEQIDVHLGGTDLIFPHHENENAQSEALFGKPLARYWLHSTFITIDGQKMAKSLDNVLCLNDLTKKQISPLSFRYFLLMAHYRTQLNFTWAALAGAAKTYERLENFARGWAEAPGQGKVILKYQRAFDSALDDDLNLPRALAVIWEMSQAEREKRRDKLATLLDFDQVLGLDLNKATRPLDIPAEIKKLSAEREAARQKSDWKKADGLRQAIFSSGYLIEDTPTGPKIRRKI